MKFLSIILSLITFCDYVEENIVEVIKSRKRAIKAIKYSLVIKQNKKLIKIAIRKRVIKLARLV